MRKTLAKIHTWLGLLSAPLIVLLGLSGLIFNHNFAFMDWGGSQVSWEAPLSVEDTPNDSLLSARIRQALNLKGMLFYWAATRGEDGSFSFPLKHPGKSYDIRVDAGRSHAWVKETRFSLPQVIAEMHGGRPVANSRISRVWEFYNDVGFAFVLFAVASGLYFWKGRRNKGWLGWCLLICITGGSLLLMIYIRLRG